jgi:replicative DNA helicase
MVDRRHISFLSRNSILPDNFRDKEKRVFEFLTEHAGEYGILPQPETVERSLELSFPDYPNEPIEYWITRLRVRQESRLIADGTNSVRELLNEGKLAEARSVLKSTVSEIEVINPSSQLFPLHELGKGVLEDTKDRQMSGGIKGISFGIPYMDEVTDGAQGGDSIAICGRPGSGKTYVLSKAVVAGYQQHKVPMVVTMEMSAKQLARRQLGLLEQVSVTQIRLGRLSHWGEQKLRNGIVSLENAHNDGHPFYILQGNLMTTVEDVGNFAKEMRPDALYVDGAYLMMSNLKFGSKWERISHTAEYLKSLALTLDIPVISTYQFNRKGGGSLANIGGADSVGQLASIVIGIETESATDEASIGSWSSVDYKILEFLKGREGEKGKVRIMFDTERTVIEQDEVIIDEAAE